MSQTLSLSLRPTSLESFIGNSSVTASIKKQLAERVPNGMLLSGAPGLGKTTLSKIIARLVNDGVEEDQIDLHEINGSSENGIDKIRELVEKSSYRPFSGRRVIIVNEAQGLTSAAKQALLDPLEASDGGTLWIFTSMSEKMDKDEKLDKAFRRRCVHYVLKPMTDLEIKALVQRAAENSSLDYDTTTFIAHIIKAKVGSPGEIIAAWEKYSSGTPLAECLIGGVHEPLYADIARFVLKGDWNSVRVNLEQIKVGDFKGLRAVVAAFLKSSLLKENVGPRADTLSEALMGMLQYGGGTYEDGIAYSGLVGIMYRCCKKLKG